MDGVVNASSVGAGGPRRDRCVTGGHSGGIRLNRCRGGRWLRSGTVRQSWTAEKNGELGAAELDGLGRERCVGHGLRTTTVRIARRSCATGRRGALGV